MLVPIFVLNVYISDCFHLECSTCW